mgnify:CR=1 FL=1
MKINLTYTVNKKSIPDFYHEILNCYGLSAKNIKNSTLFIVKNILTSYTYDKDLKTYTLKNNLHQNQLDIISTVNQTISTLNAKLKAKYEQKLNDIKELCPHYFKNLDWAKTEMNSHLVTLLAIDYEHDLNQKQVVEYFELIQGKIQGKSNDDEKFNFLVNHFAEVMAHSSFFRFNVSKVYN